MKKSNFIKYDLPWIIAAVVVVILLFGKTFIDGDFSKISYDGRSFSLPTESIMPTSDITPTPEASVAPTPSAGEKVKLVLNTNSKKIHIIDCRYANSISEENRQYIEAEDIWSTISELNEQGYTLCGVCCKEYN